MDKRDWRTDLSKGICWASIAVGAALIGYLLLFLIFCGEYSNRLLDNRFLILFVLVFDLILIFLYVVLHDKRKYRAIKHPLWWLSGIYGILFCLQLIYVYHVYFYMGWDVSYVRYAAESIINGSSMAECSAETVFSTNPNNLFIFYVTYLIEKIGGLFSMKNPYLLCIYCSCLSVNLSCFLGHLVIRRLVGGRLFQGIYLLVAVITILGSPWSQVPYSDAFGMLFVMLGIWAVVCCDKSYMKWVIIAFSTVIGYRIKPTAIFPLLAICMVYGVRWLLSFRQIWKEFAVLAVSVLVFCLIGISIPLWIQHTFSFRLHPELSLTYHHFLMMGINEETNGIYNHEDFLFSSSFPDVETRKEADMEIFWNRWNTLIDEGRLGSFVAQKALNNFNDGSWAWEKDGTFYVVNTEHDNSLYDWFLDIVHFEGKYYSLYLTLMQIVWLQILLGIPFVWLCGKDNLERKACMMIMVCGLGVFVMLFEARARYLYLYSPVLLILSLCGLSGLCDKVASIVKKSQKGL